MSFRHILKMRAGRRRFVPTDADRLRTGRRVSSLAVLFVAVLALVTTWHHVYVPLHLIAHEHVEGTGVITGGGANHLDSECGEIHSDRNNGGHADDKGRRQHDSDHETHPAHDHLAGFYTVSASVYVLVLPLNLGLAPLMSEQAAPATPLTSPHERGPPRLLPA